LLINKIRNKIGFFNFSSSTKITVEQIRDFYRYSEISRWSGSANFSNQFGNIHIESTRENGKETYECIRLSGGHKWAFVSIEAERIKYQYTEDSSLLSTIKCPVTTDKKIISLITKILLYWYKKMGLPISIDETIKRMAEHEAVTVTKEIKIKVLGGVVLRILSDKTTYLLFNFFPPEKGKLTKYQTDNFEKLLAEATGKKVVHDDRELFIIFDDTQKMIDDVTSFLQEFH